MTEQPLRELFEATICADVPVTVAVVGAVAVRGFLVFTNCDVPDDDAPTPGF